jgi:hypothetical protein
MIPQDRGLEGLSSYFIFHLPIIVLMENNNYISFFGGEAKWSLNSKNYINLSLVYLGGSHSCSRSFSVVGFLCFTHSLIHSISFYSHLSFFHPLTFPHLCLCLGKEKELLKRNHGIFGCRYYWCNPTMNQDLHV